MINQRRIGVDRMRFLVLCEDEAHQRLIRGYLSRKNADFRKVFFRMSPKADGSAEQYVREEFCKAVATYRTRHPENFALIVMVDGDSKSGEDRKKQLEEVLDQRRKPGERIAILIPKRNIETWLAFFRDGLEVDETNTDYKEGGRRVHGKTFDFRAAIEAMQGYCHGVRSGDATPLLPGSFQEAVEEWQRLGLS